MCYSKIAFRLFFATLCCFSCRAYSQSDDISAGQDDGIPQQTVAQQTAVSDRSADVTSFEKEVRPLLQKYCYDCHANGGDSGNLSFDTLELPEKLLAPELWLKVLKNVRAGIMPPQDELQPTADELKALEQWIKSTAFGIDPERPDPGRVTLRRMNRTEYRNAVRDLLGFDFDVEQALPPDDVGYGFDNIGDVLSISPMRLEKFLEAAITVVEKGVPKDTVVIPSTLYLPEDFVDDNGRDGDSMSFYQERTVRKKVIAPAAGDYVINIYCKIDGDAMPRDPQECRIHVASDGEEFFTQQYHWADNDWFEDECVVHWEAGEHEIAFTTEPVFPDLKPLRSKMDYRIVSVRVDGPTDRSHWQHPPGYEKLYSLDSPPTDRAERRAYATEVLKQFATRAFRRPVSDETLTKLVDLAENTYSLEGLTFEQGIAQSIVAVLASPKFLFHFEENEPAAEGQAFAKIDELSLASRLSFALWRSIPDDELLQQALDGKLRENLETTVKRMIDDPKSQGFVEGFAQQWLQTSVVMDIPINSEAIMEMQMTKAELEEKAAAAREAQERRGRFRGFGPPGNGPPGNGPPGNGPPAGFGQPRSQPGENLNAPEQQRVDSENSSPADAAAPQGAAPAAAPNAERPRPNGPPGNGPPGFPGGGFGRRRGPPPYEGKELIPSVRTAMKNEVEAYFEHIMREDRSVLELLRSDYTFVNADLAKVYEIPDVVGPEMRKVTLPEGSPRGGVITMGSVLTVTSNPTRTSPVKRGKWILENILGAPTAPPPPNIPSLEETIANAGDRKPTQREALAIHREDALCASCHERMDPLGLALENFNGFGRFRAIEFEQPIDPSGKLVTGEEFNQVTELKEALAENHQLEFYRTLATKMLTYVLGRGPEYYDMATIDEVAERMQQNDGKFSALLMGVLESAPVHNRLMAAAVVPPAETAVSDGE